MTTPLERVRVAAVDLGATSGRVMSCEVGRDRLELTEIHRFANGAHAGPDGLVWQIRKIHREVLQGVSELAGHGRLDGIGIDSWAVDHGLLDAEGSLLHDPWSHRDSRTDGIAERVSRQIGEDELYSITGLQQLPFNTVYQLIASRESEIWPQVQRMLLLPDLLGYWLTGVAVAERTNASTTQLYDAREREWSQKLITALELPERLFPPLVDPGTRIGTVQTGPQVPTGLVGTPVLSVASHDTASAVVAVPAQGTDFAYISSGTWSLVGVELPAPVLTEQARRADFTNEAGLDDSIRFLRNVSGLWLLAQSLETWRRAGAGLPGLPGLLAQAALLPAWRTVIDVEDPRLIPPGDMPNRIMALAAEAGEPVPETPVEVVRTILDGLALAYRRNVCLAGELSGTEIGVVHIVGGGSQNTLLCQLTADALGIPVLAGPAEAAALGNALVQARALGVELPDLAAMRDLVARTHPPQRYLPRPDTGIDAAAARLQRQLTPA